jgi:microcystin-dependent protein
MAEPFMGELKLAAFNFAPKGWSLCDGQLMPINQNQPLFALLGTTYGGNGQTTFGLPDMRGRIPAHFGQGLVQGQVGGEESHRLSVAEMPAHTHFMVASSADANTPNPSNAILAASNNGFAPLTGQSPLTTLRPPSISDAGQSQAHENRQPYLVLAWMIALQGVFPSRN